MISCQIFDSPPDMSGIAHGISKSIPNPILQAASEKIVKGYLSFVKDTAGVEHRAASNMMHDNFVKAPSLWFYSHADIVAPSKDCQIVIEKWRNNDIPVEECVWENTKHIQHAREDPERYFGTLKSFLCTHKLAV